MDNKKKLIVGIFLILLVIPILSATTIGTAKRGECINLYQICENCTSNNISTILYPNTTVAVSNVNMTRDDTYYNYTFCETGILGQYIVNGYGDLDGQKTSWVYNFEVTGTGFEFSQARSTFSLGALGLLILFFILTIITIPKLPHGNTTDEYGMLLSVDHLKYARPILWVIAWVLLLAISFTASNVAMAYLGSEMFGQLFFVIYRIMFVLTYPGIIIWFLFILIQIFRDREMKRMLERGVDIQTGSSFI